MTSRGLLASAASPALVGLVLVTTSSPAAARPATFRADRCVQQGPIEVAAARTVVRSGCPLAGRVVTDGRVSMTVPPAGMSVAGDGVGRHGDVAGLTVTNTGTTIRVLRAGHAAGNGGWYLAPLSTTTTTVTGPTYGTPVMVGTTATTVQRGSTAACQDSTYHLEHHKWVTSLRYHLNVRKMPQSFHTRTVVRQVKAADANMRLGRNTCGKPRLKTPASHYLGRTRKAPNIKVSGPTCGDPNTTNVVGFGNLPGGLLGWTCYWYNGRGRMVAADMVIDNGTALTTHLPSPCTNEWDFEGTVTHEFGHVYGMAHTGPGHPNLTMQHLLTPCSTYARTLGLGDWLGMNKMYGHR